MNSGLDATSYSYEKFIDVLIEKDITPSNPDLDSVFKICGMKLKFLTPRKNFGDENENSYVTLIEFGEIKALFTGDIEKAAETDILSRNADISADILKVGHHGSRTSSNQHFLNAVFPSVAVIQCEKDNKYGHPHKEALERLNRVGCNILRTDEEGTIVLSTDGKTIRRSTGEEYESTEENLVQLEVLVAEDDLGRVIGKNGKTIKSVRNIVQASATLNGGQKVKIDVDSY